MFKNKKPLPKRTPPASPGSTPKTDAYTPTNFSNQKIDQTLMNHEHEAGINTKEAIDQPRVNVKGKYTFCFNGGSLDDMFKGFEVELDTSMNPIQCRDYLQSKLNGKINMKDKQLIVYLSGGLPFIGGTLGDVYLNKDPKFDNVIYGVITRKVSDIVLKSSYPELCNISDPDRKLLMSPLCDSSDRGLTDIACLFGYLNHDGAKGDLLLRTCAKVITFAPLITSIRRIIDRNQVVGRDVIAVSSTLFTFFRNYIPPTTKDNLVNEYSLRLCNLVSHINNPPEDLPLLMTEVKSGVQRTKFLSDLKLGPIVYIWQGDTGKTFKRFLFELQGTEAIQNAYNIIASFKPIAPLSMRAASGCSIVRGKDHEYLYLMQSPSKDVMDQNKVDIIDPTTGLTESVDVEDFAKKQGDTGTDKTEDLIEPDQVKQVIMVNFDESGSMTCDLDGYSCKKGSDKYMRVTIAYQYLTTFANRTYGYRIACIQGLISFNNNITLRCPLSPLVPDFEDKGLKKVQPTNVTRLWDSLQRACEELVKFRKDSNNNERFINAVSRVLVISDGEDVESKAKVEDVVKELIKNKIIVDSVIVSAEDECKMLCAVCHITGGVCFRPASISEGLSLFELSAFLNYHERKVRSDPVIPDDRTTTPRKLTPDRITAQFMENAKKNATFDTKIIDSNIAQATSSTVQTLATPAHICAMNKDAIIPLPRNRRILRELHAAIEICDPKQSLYDPDIKVYTYKINLDRWKVFIKGPEGTPYENKWWYILVTFPELYPIQPPIFRFITIPYHLNVSSEGRICLNIIEKGYISSKHVIDILQEIKELFLLPNADTPIKLETLDTFKNNYAEYERLARKSSQDNAKDNYEDYITAHVDDTVPDDFSATFEKHVPPYMISQISGKQIKNPILASSGVYYDKDELKQLVTSNRNPRCIITGKLLDEKPEDFDENDAI
ncbi:hypothetical protein M9Y10_044105 [Tritrichomonas musculus]|uniref:UBC core domain-containing protein n=1 Tax=Tritrichomonas musculus TaxID=1915356 RepID=A0ABR2K1J8_9EUKA